MKIINYTSFFSKVLTIAVFIVSVFLHNELVAKTSVSISNDKSSTQHNNSFSNMIIHPSYELVADDINITNDTIKHFKLTASELWKDSIIQVELRYGNRSQLYDTLIDVNVNDLSSINRIILPRNELGIMGELINGVEFNQGKLLEDSTLRASIIYSQYNPIYRGIVKIKLEEQGVRNSVFRIDLYYEKLGIENEDLIKINLNEADLKYDSLFSLKVNYERLGAIEDSLMIIEVSQVALLADSIDEQIVYSKIVDYSTKSTFDFKILYEGYKEVSRQANANNLSSLQRVSIIPMRKSLKAEEPKYIDNEDNKFVFIGTIFEEGTKIRLPNVRVIIRDRNDHNKQFVELTDAYGSFRDSVGGYPIKSLLSFDIFLKKEGYISKFVVFEEVLNEYGEVDLEEYLKKIGLTKAAVGVEIGKAANLNPIYFDFDKADIRLDAKVELDKVVEVLNDLPNVSIELSSHTDSRATDRYNMALSQRRANSTTNYLISKGINPSRITSVGYGESQLVNHCKNGISCSEDLHALNRRTEFEITDMIAKENKQDVSSIEQKSTESKSDGSIVSTKDEKILGVTGESLAAKEKRKEFSETESIDFYCSIIDVKTGKPINGVEVVVSDIFDSKNIYTTRANERGEFSLKIRDYQFGDKVYLDFLFSKNGYISKTLDYREKIKEDFNAFINLNKYFDDIYLVPADLNIDIGKAANILPIRFGLNNSNISKEASIELDKIAAILLEQPNLSIELGSHTDARGDDSYNLKLSERRANATMDYLVSKGISYSRITAVGYGEQKILNKCKNGIECSEDEHAFNRRTEFRIK